MTQYLQKIVK